MIGTAAKIVIGLIVGVAMVIAVMVALGVDLMAPDTRPKFRRQVRNARATLRHLEEAHT